VEVLGLCIICLWFFVQPDDDYMQLKHVADYW